jgi:DUF1365 family protein
MPESPTSALYEGVVVHKRLRPVRHTLRYHVFSLLLDCEALPDLDRRLRLFSYNRFNILSLHDQDHGDGSSLRHYLRGIAAKSGAKIEAAAGTVSQTCRKSFYVSPFNAVEGRYSFHLTPPGDEITVGIALENDEGPVLKAYFRATRSDLSDSTLLAALLRTGWLSVKVIAAIHFEALKLWLKGLRPTRRPPAPKTAIAFIPSPREN